jgi:hypothetical protein
MVEVAFAGGCGIYSSSACRLALHSTTLLYLRYQELKLTVQHKHGLSPSSPAYPISKRKKDTRHVSASAFPPPLSHALRSKAKTARAMSSPLFRSSQNNTTPPYMLGLKSSTASYMLFCPSQNMRTTTACRPAVPCSETCANLHVGMKRRVWR